MFFRTVRKITKGGRRTFPYLETKGLNHVLILKNTNCIERCNETYFLQNLRFNRVGLTFFSVFIISSHKNKNTKKS